ncbi:hypothetical protein WI87_18845 [Burkholderia ubonensis]|uniref:Uncharacterized protein n=2 Tax=Burkholderia ubonensis TaxID=101571 RepID=A0AAW3MXS4_9BURK|nr:hypothetical protein WI87_18845 [Burkholderia ubonensis]KVT40597.1 hypothetical protein WK53_20630 [Burkholderia ubonensis]
MAYWVQAIGSIAALIGAIWIASDQHRRDVSRREKEDKEFEYVLNAELAWLSHDVLNFLNQFFRLQAGQLYVSAISDDDVSDMLERLSWCRQRAKHKGQLAMIGQMRASLMTTLRIVRARMSRPSKVFEVDEIESIRELRAEAVSVMQAANGSTNDPRFTP